MPTLISGNVVPSATQGGRIKSAATSHLAMTTAVPPPSAGNSQS